MVLSLTRTHGEYTLSCGYFSISSVADYMKLLNANFIKNNTQYAGHVTRLLTEARLFAGFLSIVVSSIQSYVCY